MQQTIADLMEQDASKRFRPPTDDDLKTVGELANRQLAIENLSRNDVIRQVLDIDPSVPELEEALKAKKEELTKLREIELPNALEQFGLSEIKLLDGSRVTIKSEIYAGITEENKEPAFKWLTATGNEGIIKNEVKCPFGKGQDAEARQLVDTLTTLGFSFTNSRSVHPMTLKAFVKKQIEDGKPIPTDLFSIHPKKIAIIKLK